MTTSFEPPTPDRLTVDDPSQVRVAVTVIAGLARSSGFPPHAVDTIALAATELAENLHRHARGGQLLALPPVLPDDVFLLIAIDRGPGVERFELCLTDGYTTIGTMGIGLGTVRRLAHRFDAVSEPGIGTVVAASFARTAGPAASAAHRVPASAFDVGSVGFPVPPEIRNGDSWAALHRGSRLVLTVADGLGHGPDAALASRAVVDALAGVADLDPVAMIAEFDRAARRTRGAAVTVATLESDALRLGGVVDSAGLGNVGLAVIAPDGSTQRAVSGHGTAGRGAPRTRAYATPFRAGSTLVLHTDGLVSRWDLSGRAELLRHDAVVVAAALWRDFARDTDDSCVLVARAGTAR